MYAFEVELSKLPKEVLAVLNPSLGRTSNDGTRGAIRWDVAVRAYPDIDIESLPITRLETRADYSALLSTADYEVTIIE